jgi:hypothetical protein
MICHLKVRIMEQVKMVLLGSGKVKMLLDMNVTVAGLLDVVLPMWSMLRTC